MTPARFSSFYRADWYRAETRDEAIRILRGNGESVGDAHTIVYYATPLPPGPPAIDYRPGERRPYRLDGKPVPYGFALMSLMQDGGMTRREAAAVLRVYKICAEIEKALETNDGD